MRLLFILTLAFCWGRCEAQEFSSSDHPYIQFHERPLPIPPFHGGDGPQILHAVQGYDADPHCRTPRNAATVFIEFSENILEDYSDGARMPVKASCAPCKTGSRFSYAPLPRGQDLDELVVGDIKDIVIGGFRCANNSHLCVEATDGTYYKANSDNVVIWPIPYLKNKKPVMLGILDPTESLRELIGTKIESGSNQLMSTNPMKYKKGYEHKYIELEGISCNSCNGAMKQCPLLAGPPRTQLRLNDWRVPGTDIKPPGEAPVAHIEQPNIEKAGYNYNGPETYSSDTYSKEQKSATEEPYSNLGYEENGVYVQPDGMNPYLDPNFDLNDKSTSNSGNVKAKDSQIRLTYPTTTTTTTTTPTVKPVVQRFTDNRRIIETINSRISSQSRGQDIRRAPVPVHMKNDFLQKSLFTSRLTPKIHQMLTTQAQLEVTVMPLNPPPVVTPQHQVQLQRNVVNNIVEPVVQSTTVRVPVPEERVPKMPENSQPPTFVSMNQSPQPENLPVRVAVQNPSITIPIETSVPLMSHGSLQNIPPQFSSQVTSQNVPEMTPPNIALQNHVSLNVPQTSSPEIPSSQSDIINLTPPAVHEQFPPMVSHQNISPEARLPNLNLHTFASQLPQDTQPQSIPQNIPFHFIQQNTPIQPVSEMIPVQFIFRNPTNSAPMMITQNIPTNELVQLLAAEFMSQNPSMNAQQSPTFPEQQTFARTQFPPSVFPVQNNQNIPTSKPAAMSLQQNSTVPTEAQQVLKTNNVPTFDSTTTTFEPQAVTVQPPQPIVSQIPIQNHNPVENSFSIDAEPKQDFVKHLNDVIPSIPRPIQSPPQFVQRPVQPAQPFISSIQSSQHISTTTSPSVNIRIPAHRSQSLFDSNSEPFQRRLLQPAPETINSIWGQEALRFPELISPVEQSLLLNSIISPATGETVPVFQRNPFQHLPFANSAPASPPGTSKFFQTELRPEHPFEAQIETTTSHPDFLITESSQSTTETISTTTEAITTVAEVGSEADISTLSPLPLIGGPVPPPKETAFDGKFTQESPSIKDGPPSQVPTWQWLMEHPARMRALLRRRKMRV